MNRGFFDREPEAPAQPEPNSYDVGYGKPPAQSRFKSGKSGNPAGRPKKKKAQTTTEYSFGDQIAGSLILEEAHRPVVIREGGKTTTMSTMQAVMRSLNLAAIKGDRVAAKTVLKFVKAAEREEADLIALLNYKSQTYLDYTRLQSARAKARGLPEPRLEGPHPDDFYFNNAEGFYEIKVFTPAEKKYFAKVQEHLDDMQESVTDWAQNYAASDDPEEKQSHLSNWILEQSLFDKLQSVLPDRYQKALKDRSLQPGASKRDRRPHRERYAAYMEGVRARKAAAQALPICC